MMETGHHLQVYNVDYGCATTVTDCYENGATGTTTGDDSRPCDVSPGDWTVVHPHDSRKLNDVCAMICCLRCVFW